MGLVIMPDCERFTLSISVACWSGAMLRWMMPMPPSRARAIARRASLTVSIAAEISGIFSRILPVSCELQLIQKGPDLFPFILLVGVAIVWTILLQKINLAWLFNVYFAIYLTIVYPIRDILHVQILDRLPIMGLLQSP